MEIYMHNVTLWRVRNVVSILTLIISHATCCSTSKFYPVESIKYLTLLAYILS
jgi:hypothetical protein